MLTAILPLLRKSFLSERPVIYSTCRLQMRRLNSLTWNNQIGDIAIAPRHEEKRTPEEIWRHQSEMAKSNVSQHPPANAYSGRSVKVNSGNVAEAYARLHAILQRNKVRAQLRRAERHEKKGEKRRRLESERWRRQFAHEVRKKVQLVTKIRNRGA